MADHNQTTNGILNSIRNLLGPNNICIGFETLSVGATVVTLASIPTDATGCIFQVESTTAAPAIALRYIQGGTTLPTTLVGTFGTHGDQIEVVGQQGLQQLKLINVAGTTKINVTYFK